MAAQGEMRAHEHEQEAARDMRRAEQPDQAPHDVHALLGLQRLAGNRAVGELIHRGSLDLTGATAPPPSNRAMQRLVSPPVQRVSVDSESRIEDLAPPTGPAPLRTASVQRVTVQREGDDDLTLPDEGDHSGFQLTKDTEPPEQHGGVPPETETKGGDKDEGTGGIGHTEPVDLESGDELPGQELRTGEVLTPESMMKTKANFTPKHRLEYGPATKLWHRLRDKTQKIERRNPKGGKGWKALSEVVRVGSGIEGSYRRGGVHEQLSGYSRALSTVEKWVREDHLEEAESLLDGQHLDAKAFKVGGLRNRIESPILSARKARLKAEGRRLRKLIEKKKKLRGTDELKQAPRSVELESGEGLEGEQLA